MIVPKGVELGVSFNLYRVTIVIIDMANIVLVGDEDAINPNILTRVLFPNQLGNFADGAVEADVWTYWPPNFKSCIFNQRFGLLSHITSSKFAFSQLYHYLIV